MSGSAQGPSPREGRGRRAGLLRAAGREALDFLGVAHRERRRRAPPGARPDHMVIPRDALPPRIEWIFYSPDRFEEREVADVAELRGALETPEIDWINVRGFGGEETLRSLGEIFGIHPLALADVVNVPQRPKVDVYGDQRLIVLRMAQVSGARVDLHQVSLVTGPGWVVTFEEREGDVFDPVRARIRTDGTQLRRLGADYLAYALIDAVVDGFFPVLDHLADVIEDLEHQAIGSPEPRTLGRIHAARRLLTGLERVQRHQRDALIALARDEGDVFSEGVRPYLRDVQDHAIHVQDMIASLRDMTVGLMDIYLSSVSNRTNDVMKTLTIMATIFIPLTFLAGVYGMNFRYMPELSWRWGYPAVWGVMLASAAGLLWWFRRRGWLGRVAPDDPGDGDEGDDPDAPL